MLEIRFTSPVNSIFDIFNHQSQDVHFTDGIFKFIGQEKKYIN
jgi:hypothetical protein